MDADRFGISQLHQLRGRIGRGAIPACACWPPGCRRVPRPGARLKAVAGTLDGFELADLDLEQRREGDVLGLNQSGRQLKLHFLSLVDHLEIIQAARALCESNYAQQPAKSGDGPARRSVHRHRRRLPGQVVNRRRTWWVAVAAVLAVLVAVQVDTGRSHGAVRRPGRDPRRSHREPTSGGSARGAGQVRGNDYRRAAFGESWTDDTDAPGGPTAATPATTSSSVTCSTRRMCRSVAAPTPVATGTLHDPYTKPIRFLRARAIRRAAAVQIDHLVPLAWPGTSARGTGPTTARCGSRTIPANLLAVGRGQSGQGRWRARGLDAAEPGILVSVRRPVRGGAARLRRCRSMRRQRGFCVVCRDSAHEADRNHRGTTSPTARSRGPHRSTTP